MPVNLFTAFKFCVDAREARDASAQWDTIDTLAEQTSEQYLSEASDYNKHNRRRLPHTRTPPLAAASLTLTCWIATLAASETSALLFMYTSALSGC